MIKIAEIEKIINIKRPLLFLDKVLEMEKGDKVKCVKMFSYNENFFQGHFLGNPIVPGTILIECMIQSIKLMYFSEFTYNDKLFYSCSLPIVNFRKSVIPGDELIIEGKLIEKKDFFTGVVKCNVNELEVCNLTINF
jgi:3-hydroxyacyl-[acyl-carrier-protein] dehydratase